MYLILDIGPVSVELRFQSYDQFIPAILPFLPPENFTVGMIQPQCRTGTMMASQYFWNEGADTCGCSLAHAWMTHPILF